MPTAWLVATVVLSVGGSGCAVPFPSGPATEREIMLGYSASNPSLGQIHRVVVGLDLGLGRETRMVALGFSDLRILVPKPRSNGVAPPPAPTGCAFAPPLGVRCRAASGTTRRFGFVVGRYPIGALRDLDTGFIHHQLVGLSARAGSVLRGISIGAGGESLLWAPARADMLVELDYRSDHPEGNTLTYSSGGNEQ